MREVLRFHFVWNQSSSGTSRISVQSGSGRRTDHRQRQQPDSERIRPAQERRQDAHAARRRGVVRPRGQFARQTTGSVDDDLVVATRFALPATRQRFLRVSCSVTRCKTEQASRKIREKVQYEGSPGICGFCLEKEDYQWCDLHANFNVNTWDANTCQHF